MWQSAASGCIVTHFGMADMVHHWRCCTKDVRGSHTVPQRDIFWQVKMIEVVEPSSGCFLSWSLNSTKCVWFESRRSLRLLVRLVVTLTDLSGGRAHFEVTLRARRFAKHCSYTCAKPVKLDLQPLNDPLNAESQTRLLTLFVSCPARGRCLVAALWHAASKPWYLNLISKILQFALCQHPDSDIIQLFPLSK
jgi:hypothetical protein